MLICVDDALINFAKEKLERRRCNHHELEEPLSSLECISAVVDPKGSHTNKHRYVVASQSPKVRAHMRTIAGVPNVYINKSVSKWFYDTRRVQWLLPTSQSFRHPQSA